MNEDCLKHGAFGWTELMTTDDEAARQFYSALFGWETEEAPMEVMEGMEGMKYAVIKVDGDPVGGLTGMPPECQGMPPSWGVYVTVDDVDATASRVEELGGKLLRPPADIPNVGRFCVIQDPQGAALCAITYVKK
jgi:predicted enzyme related to lactoylglutathione lyase